MFLSIAPNIEINAIKQTNMKLQTIDLERTILGCAMQYPDGLNTLLEMIDSDKYFVHTQTKAIYRVIHDLNANGNNVDVLTVVEHSRRLGMYKECGEAYGITTLLDGAPYSFNQKTNCAFLIDRFTLTELGRLSKDIGTKVVEELDPYKIADAAMTELVDLQFRARVRNTYDTTQLNQLITDELVDIAKNGVNAIGVPVRLTSLKRIVPCWGNGKLIIVAARPGMGKTSFVQNAINDCAFVGKSVLLFSLEMDAKEISYRLMSSITNTMPAKYSAMQLKASATTADDANSIFHTVIPQLQSKFNTMYFKDDAPLLYIDDKGGVNIGYIKNKAREISAQSKAELGCIIVDYIGLMDDNSRNGDNKSDRIGEITSSLKAISKEFKVPVIALSQLSREVEKRGDKRPMLSDLRSSGSIEQDADVVIFLYRPEYYSDCNSYVLHCESGQEVSAKGYGEIIVAKNRSGSLGSAAFRFVPETTTICNEVEAKQPIYYQQAQENAPF